MPHLPGTPRPASTLPPGSAKAASTQAHPSSPGNIRPIKKEVKVEPEKKDPEKKVANEPSVKGRAPLVKVEEAPVEEGTPIEPTDPGKNRPAGSGCAVVFPLFSLFMYCFIQPFSPYWIFEFHILIPLSLPPSPSLFFLSSLPLLSLCQHSEL